MASRFAGIQNYLTERTFPSSQCSFRRRMPFLSRLVPDISHSSARGAGREAVVLATALTASVLAYAESWSRFPTLWTGDRTHGFAIALLCGWMLWRDRERLTSRGTPQRWGLAVVFSASLVWLLAVAMSIQAVHLLVAPVILVGWSFAALGERSGQTALRIAAFFLLAMPLWEALLGPLQWLTVLVNRSLIALTGVPAAVSGTAIKFATGTLVVAYSCAGLNFLMAGLTLGAAYAVLFVSDGKTQLKIIGLAAGVSIVSNWLRVFGLVLIAYATDMRSSLMQDHVLYGWLMFGGSLPLFFMGASRIERAAAVRLTVAPQSDHAVTNITPPAASAAFVGRAVAVALATAAALVGPLLLYGLQSSAPTLTVPARAPGVAWSAVQGAPPSANVRLWQAGFRNASERRSELISSDGRILQVDRFIYGQQRQGAEMISSENQVANDSLLVGEGSIGPLDAQARIVREAYVRDGTQVRVVWYWYRSAGVETASPMRAKLLELWAFFSRRDASEIVAVSTTCSEPTCVSSRNTMFLAVTGRPMAPSAGNR